MLYLMIDEKKDFALCKVGYTKNIQTRMLAYSCCNPYAKCISTMETYNKTKHGIEQKFHAEIEKKGYKFITSVNLFKSTEWFIVEYNDPFYTELKVNGLKAFKSGQNRKELGGMGC